MHGIGLRMGGLLCALAFAFTAIPVGAAAAPVAAENIEEVIFTPGPEVALLGSAEETGALSMVEPQAVAPAESPGAQEPATATDASGEDEASPAAESVISSGADFVAALKGLAKSGSLTIRLGASFTAVFTEEYTQPEGSTLTVITDGHTAEISFTGSSGEGPYLYTLPAKASLLLDDTAGGGLNLTGNVPPDATASSGAASGAILYAFRGARAEVSTITDLAGLPHLDAQGIQNEETQVHIKGGIVSGGAVPLNRIIFRDYTKIWIEGELPDIPDKTFLGFFSYGSAIGDGAMVAHCVPMAKNDYDMLSNYPGYLQYSRQERGGWVWLNEAANVDFGGENQLTVRAGTGGTLVSNPSGSYAGGARIPLAAKASSGYTFVGWLSLPSGAFEDATATETLFEMPQRPVEVVAQFIPNLKSEEWKGLAATNAERVKRDKPPYATARQLTLATRVRSDEIVKKFSHDRPDGTKCFTALKEYGVDYYTAGENIAAGYGTVAATVNQWMNSPGHKANILQSSFDQMAMTHTEKAGTTYTHYWTQMFVGHSSTQQYINLPASQANTYAKTGTSLNNLNLRLILTYEDGFTATIPVIKEMCTGYNLGKEGEQTITINFSGAALKQVVTLTADGKPPRNPIPGILTLTHNGGAGGPAVGDTMSLTPWEDEAITARYNWLRDGAVITGATGQSYTVTRQDLGHSIRAMATGYGNYTGQTTSNAITVPAVAPDAPAPAASLRADGYHLQWSAPFSGGSAITGYNIYLEGEPTPLNSSPVAARSYRVDFSAFTGPSLPITATFEVTALNAAGESPRGAASYTLTQEDTSGILALDGNHFTLPQGGSQAVKLDFTPDNPLLPATLETLIATFPGGGAATGITAAAAGAALNLAVDSACAPGAYTVTVRLAKNPAIGASVRLDVTRPSRQPGADQVYEARKVETTKVTVYTLKETPAEILLQPPAFEGSDVPWPLHDETRFALSFANPTLDSALSLKAVDARTIRATARGDLNTLLPGGSYKSTLVVTPLDGGGTPEIVGEITFKLNRKPPALKATALKINYFYDDVTLPVVASGGEISALAEAKPLPAWLELDGTSLRLKQVNSAYKKASATVKLTATVKGWGSTPVPLSVKVSAASTAPGLKLSPATVKVFADLSRGGGTAGKLAPKKAGLSLESLGVLGLSVDPTANYSLTGFDLDTGAFTLAAKKTDTALKSGTLPLNVTLEGRSKPYTLSLKVNVVAKGAKISFKAGSSTLKLNPAAGDSAVVKLTPNVPGVWVPAADASYDVLGPDGNPITSNEPLKADLSTLNDGYITVRTTGHAQANTSYKLKINIKNLNEDGNRKSTGQTITLKVVTPKTSAVKATLTVKGAANLTTGAPATATLKFTNFTGGLTREYAAAAGIDPATLLHISRVEKGVAKGAGADVSPSFTVAQTGTGTFSITPNPTATDLASGSYYIQLSPAGEAALQAAMPTAALTVKGAGLKLSAPAPRLTQSAKPGTLYRQDALVAAKVAIASPAGARAITGVQIKPGKNSEYFDVNYSGGVCTITFKPGSGYQDLTAKTVTLKLEVKLAGNQKATKTLSYKVILYG